MQQSLIGWGVSLPDAVLAGSKARWLCEAATVYCGARRAVVLALNGVRLTLGVLTLTQQILDRHGDLQDPGLTDAVCDRPTGSGILRLPAGPALYAVRTVALTASVPVGQS
ncbi:hypothetical protein ACFVYR_31740 [Streptomyces sp. NPDC058284]|uniref:hypothetical protein n=1 Tax=unclassified Streptomyces TaxID=2593676 RepID=UPI003655629E